MAFNSYIFVLVFLPFTLLGYFLLNHFNQYQLSKIYLLAMSLWFYTNASINYLWILLVSISANYALCLVMDHLKYNLSVRKTVFVITLLFNLGLLFYFKYCNFFLSTLNTVFSTGYSFINVIVPLGISFYTFQQLSYVIDLYEHKIELCCPLDYAVFSTFFPDIVSGPIILHGSIIPQLNEKSRKEFSYENMNKGLYLFALGLGKKVLIADTLGAVVDAGYNSLSDIGFLVMLFVVIAYTLQIYFDFSGYSDMARGAALMLNIDIPVNFDSPYKAESIRDFWKRWHISLTEWLTQYIYFPLGGNRKGNVRTYVNILIVFIVSGIWHGANYTFILWGLLHGIAQCVTRVGHPFFAKLPKWLNQLLVFVFVNVAWVLFRSSSIAQAVQVFHNLFSFSNITAGSSVLSNIYLSETRFLVRYRTFIDTDVMVIAWGILIVLLGFVFKAKNTNEKADSYQPSTVNVLLVSLILIWCIVSFANVGTFIYSNF